MKKITKYIIAAAIILISSNSFAQKIFVKLNGGYNWGTAFLNEKNNTQVGNVHSFESVRISFGKGISWGGAVGYMFNKFIGAELGVNYLIGGNSTINVKNPYEQLITNYSSTMFSCVPTILFCLGFKRVNPYIKLGLIVGSGSFAMKSDHASSNNGGPYIMYNTIKLYNGSFALGLNAALGATYNFNEYVSLFGEVNSTNLSYAPTKSEITEYKVNGVDNLSKITNNSKYTEYVESFTDDYSVVQDKNIAGKDLIKSYPFNSVGFNVGLQYNF